MTEFSTTVEIPVRYRDIDSINHVNNATYVTYLEEARVQYINDVLGADPSRPGFVVAAVSVEYEQPIVFGQDVVVALSVTDIGTSSITMDYEIRADGDVAATAETVIVTVDPEGDGPRPVPDEWRERIGAHEGKEF